MHMPPHVIDGASSPDVAFVVARMRDIDRSEADAFGFVVEDVAPLVVQSASDVWTAVYRDRPAFIFGTVELLPGVRQLFGFGTDDTKRVMPAVTWFTENYWLDALFESGVRRIQAHVPTTHHASIEWLEGFGMYRECTMHDYAVNGTPMLQLAYTTREHRENVLVVEEATKPGTRRRSSASEVECGHTGRSGVGAQEAEAFH